MTATDSTPVVNEPAPVTAAPNAPVTTPPVVPAPSPAPAAERTVYSLPGVSWLSVQVGGSSATIDVGGVVVPVAVSKLADGAPVRVQADLSQVTLATISQAALTTGSVDPLTVLPPALAQTLAPVAITSVGVSLDLAAHRLVGFDLQVGAVASWSLMAGSVQLDDPSFRLAFAATATGPSVQASAAATFAGAEFVITLGRDPVSAGAAAWSLHAGLADGATLSVAAVATAFGLALPAGVPELALSGCTLDAVLDGSAVTFAATSPTGWTLPFGPSGLGLGQLALTFTRQHTPDGAGSSTGSIAGVVHLAGVDVPVTYAVPGGLTLHAGVASVAPFALIQDVVGAASVGALTLPPELLTLALSDVVLALDVEAGELSFAAGGPGFKRVQAVVRKATDWGFAVGIELDDSYRFSTLSPALAGLDAVRLPHALIVISSFDDTSFTFEELQPVAGTGVSKGVLLDGQLDLSGLGADTFLGRAHLDVKARIGASLADLELDAGVGDVLITDGVVLKDAEFTLRPDPENVSVSVSGAVDVTIDSSPLQFTGGVTVVPNGISFFATMLGTWQDPFGAAGIALRDVSLQIGSDFEGIPSIGIAGGLTIGAFTGNAAVSFNSQLPSQSVLIVAFNHLSLMDVVATFCPPAATADIPADVTGTLAGISLQDVDLYVVPQDTSIGALSYKQGLRVGGTLHVAGFTAQADVEIDQSEGIRVSGSLSPVVIADVFSLTGPDPATGPAPAGPDLDIAITTSAVPKVALDGRVALLGLTAGASVSLSDSGFDFTCQGNVFGLFSADVHAQGGTLSSGAGFMVRAALSQDFLSDLARRAAALLQQAGADAQAQISLAEQGVAGAQADVSRFTASLSGAQADLAAAQSDAQATLGMLSQAVTQAQQSLDTVNAQIQTVRSQITSQRDAAAASLRDLQARLAAAKGVADSLNAQVAAQQAQINQLNSDIAWWNNWYNNLAWYDKTWGWAQLGAEVGWRGTQVAGLTVSIGGLRGSLLAANGALQAAQQAVNAALAAQASYPVDQDPRILGLQGGRSAAQLALGAAQSTLSSAQQTAAVAISVAGQSVAAFQQQLGGANAVLATANTALTHLSQTIGDVAAVSAYVAAHGLDALIDVRSASFAGALSATSGGSVALDADVVFQGSPTTVHVAYDFHDLVAGAKAVAKQLLPALPV